MPVTIEVKTIDESVGRERRLIDRLTYKLCSLFDCVIYLYGTTCANPTALVMTFAHELQHFVQYGLQRRLWAENALLKDLPGMKTADLPIEQEARICAKGVAERICGPEAVDEYIDRRIAESENLGDEGDELEDWLRVKNLDSSTQYRLADETRAVFQRQAAHKTELGNRLRQREHLTDYAEVDLSIYFSQKP